ncbi:MAG TPA: HAD-IA family hydrolase [Candidatus Dormibacteraeota bacterium]|nr:HAD-IA family hydrolase [Candidatus Dormibacteraeota bacterium]
MELIVFDIDGVLAGVSESYHEAIVRTVEHFTGKRISRDLIQQYKNRGGWNNDWALSRKIAADLGITVEYQCMVERFNKFFLGNDGDGLIQREEWLPRPGLLERLMDRCGLAIFTGRVRREAGITMQRFVPGVRFSPIICADDVTTEKPAPDGILAIQRLHPGRELVYVGDTVDDARSASAAGVPFIGIAAQSHSRCSDLIRLFEQERAIAILENVNEIEAVL